MRKSLFFCGVVVALLSTVTSAQSQTEDELAHQKQETERRALVSANLPLLNSEAEAFWELYLEYRVAIRESDDQRADLLRRVKDSKNEVTEDDGIGFVTESLRIDKQRQEPNQSYLMKISHFLPGSRLFRYSQIEPKLDALKRNFWTSQVNLAPVPE